MVTKNKRGWIEIVEAFFSIMLIMAILVLAINKSNNQQSDVSSGIYGSENHILSSVQLNDTLRGEIIGISDSLLPVGWNSSSFPSDVKSGISSLTPGSLNCEAVVCTPGDTCSFDTGFSGSIYAQSIIITSTLQSYDPKELKILCSQK